MVIHFYKEYNKGYGVLTVKSAYHTFIPWYVSALPSDICYYIFLEFLELSFANYSIQNNN